MHPYVYVFASIVLGVFGQVLMKWGTMRPSFAAAHTLWQKIAQLVLNVPIAAGLACYAVSAIFWVMRLAKMPLSQAYPMVAAGYVLVFAMSLWLFHEPFSWLKAGGLLLIVMGVLVLAKS